MKGNSQAQEGPDTREHAPRVENSDPEDTLCKVGKGAMCPERA